MAFIDMAASIALWRGFCSIGYPCAPEADPATLAALQAVDQAPVATFDYAGPVDFQTDPALYSAAPDDLGGFLASAGGVVSNYQGPPPATVPLADWNTAMWSFWQIDFTLPGEFLGSLVYSSSAGIFQAGSPADMTTTSTTLGPTWATFTMPAGDYEMDFITQNSAPHYLLAEGTVLADEPGTLALFGLALWALAGCCLVMHRNAPANR